MSPFEEKRGRALLIKWKKTREPIRLVLTFEGMVTVWGFGTIKEASDKDALVEGKDWSVALEFSLGHFGSTITAEDLTETPLTGKQAEATTFLFALHSDKCFLSSVQEKGGKPN